MISAFSSGGYSRNAPRFVLCCTALAALVFLPVPPASAQFAITPAVPSGSPLGDAEGQETVQADPSANPPVDRSVPQPVTVSGSLGTTATTRTARTALPNAGLAAPLTKAPAEPGEYESWIAEVIGRDIKRFGTDLLLPSERDFAVPANSTIPPDYPLNIGDVVSIALTGSIESSADFEIDRNGQINLPRVGTVRLAGVRYRDLQDRVREAVGRQFRGFEVSASISQLRGLRVYVTGFANNPGAYSVNSLSTLVNAVLAAGGPSAGGSFRSVKLYRNGREVVDFDLYEFIREGDKSRDALLQNEDVLFIPAVGNQVAVVGSVNEEAIYELKPGETVEDALRVAGGITSLGDADRLIVYRLDDRDTTWNRQISRADAATFAVRAGDIVQALPEGSLARPLDRQATVVRLEGEVNRPGNYYVRPGTSLADVLEMAGGVTSRAYVYGTNLRRLSVQIQQKASYEEAIRQLELAIASAPLTLDSQEIIGAQRMEAARQVVDRLRASQPDGRVVLPLDGVAAALPGDLVLENNDTIYIPPLPTTVGVFGAVYRPASFLMKGGSHRVKDYLDEAGGTVRAADRGEIFLVRANGSVISKKRGALNAVVLPGDVIFVPVKTRPSQFWQHLATIGQLIFGAGLSTATVISLTR